MSCEKDLQKPPPLLPLEDFFKNPEKDRFKISPNGKCVSYLASYKSRLNIFVQELNKDSTVYQVTFETERDIAGYIWANDNRLLYVKDEGGNEDFKLFAVNSDGSKKKCLTCIDGVKTMLIDELQSTPDEVIVGLNKRDPRLFDPYRLNIVTGELKLLAENNGNITRWITDHDGKLRAAVAMVQRVNKALLFRETEDDDFKTVNIATWKDEFTPLFFTFDNRMLYVSSNLGRDKQEIVVFDPKSKSEIEILFKHPEVDVKGLSYSKKRKVLTSAQYTTEKKKKYFFDRVTESIFEKLEKLLPGLELVISSTNLDETIFVVRTFSDVSRGSYYVYNSITESLTKIADISPWLIEEQMAKMKPITYNSRDGLKINGYLTLPVGREAKNLPVVINPHGGPWLRNYWGFNPEVQFLANRGYAVLQMNFRGSTGYGKNFKLKSVKEWGRAMQDDITDGTQWLIEQGIANKDRIAIYGASYGGYATLAGVTFTPDLYAAGVDYVGISNLFTFLNTIPTYWEPMRDMLYELVGHPVNDSALLKEISPVYHVENIKVPLLIAQGANDPRVKMAESEQIVEALKERGISVEYILKENEGHGFRNEENRFEFYRAMEKFLDEHIGENCSKNN